MENDRIRVQVQFKKFLWICPKCQVEEWEDRPMGGGASYVHTCINGHTFNSTCGNAKEYNGTVNYTPEEYEKVTVEELALAKQKPADDWIYSVKNPPPYVEPTKEQLEAELAEKQAEVTRLQSEIATKEVELG